VQGEVVPALNFAALCDRCSLYEGSSLKCHQDKLGRGCASDVDHSYEHSVHGMTCCYAGGKHLDVLGFRRHS